MFSPKIVLLLLVFLGQCLASPLATPTQEDISVAKRTDTRPEETPQPQGVRIYDFYMCLDARGGNVMVYTRADINRAMCEGFRCHLDQRPATSSHGNRYPRVFHWEQDWITMNRLVNTNSLIEFPLIQNGAFRTGLDAGPDRVVFDAASGIFGGVYTHRGQNNNRFVPCIGYNSDSYADDAIFDPPIWGDLPWMKGFGTGSGLDKRVVVTVEA